MSLAGQEVCAGHVKTLEKNAPEEAKRRGKERTPRSPLISQCQSTDFTSTGSDSGSQTGVWGAAFEKVQDRPSAQSPALKLSSFFLSLTD